VSLTRSQHITSAGVDRDSKLPYKFKLAANAAVTFFWQKQNTSVTGKIETFLFAIAGAHRVLGRLGTSYTRETWDRSHHPQQNRWVLRYGSPSKSFVVRWEPSPKTGGLSP